MTSRSNPWMIVVFVCFGCVVASSSVFASLKRIPSPKFAHIQHPKWSPDGTKLAYEVHKVKKSTIEIHIRDMKTGKLDKVRPSTLQTGGFNLGGGNSKRGMVAKDFSWSPKSNKYLFSSNGTGTVYNVYLSEEGILKINSPSKSDGQPSWSSNAGYIAFTSARTGSGDLYYAKMTGGKLKARRLTTYSSSTELFPVWSPTNPLQLAFLRHTEQSDRIYLIDNVFTRKSVRLTKWSTRISELNPSWSPDGSKIAFYGVTPGGRYDLFVVDAKAGSRPKRLAKNVVKSDQFGPSWAPGGKKIIYVQKLGKQVDRISVVNASGGAVQGIATGTSLNNEISVVASGGKWQLAFTAQGRNSSANLVYRKLFIKTIDPM